MHLSSVAVLALLIPAASPRAPSPPPPPPTAPSGASASMAMMASLSPMIDSVKGAVVNVDVRVRRSTPAANEGGLSDEQL